MNKLSIKFEFLDVSKIMRLPILKNFTIIKSINTSRIKYSCIVVNNNGDKFFLKIKLLDFISDDEINIYKLLKNNPHPNINKILSIYKTKLYLIILSEYISGNILLDYANDDCLFDNIDNIYEILNNSLKFMHKLNVIHCDIKPDNIMIDSNHCPFIIDFDLCHFTNSKIKSSEYTKNCSHT